MQTHRYRFHLLLHSAHLVEEHLRLQLAPLGVQPRQARILHALDNLKEASQVELARRFNVTPASMSTMTARLIKRGFIVRRTDEYEARCNVLTLTDAGRGMLSAVYAAWQDIDQMIEDLMGKDAAEALGSLTLDLRDALGGHAPVAVNA